MILPLAGNSRIVLGSRVLQRCTAEVAEAVLDRAFAGGVRAFDVARVYEGAENVLGSWIARRGVRGEVTVITKGGHPDAAAGRRRLDPESLAADVERSLAELQTDYIDLFLFHRDDPAVPVEELLSAIAPHVQTGRIRALGASNFSQQRFAEANACAASRGLPRLRASSPQLSLVVPWQLPWPGCVTASGFECEAARRWYAAQPDVAVLAWSPLASGYLTGERPAVSPGVNAVFDYPANRHRRDRLVTLARELSVRPAQVALAYVLSQGANFFAVIGPTRVETLDECLEAATITLTAEQRSRLEGTRYASPVSAQRLESDVVVVGSGLTGGWVAKELAEAGLTVTVLEAGPERDPTHAIRTGARANDGARRQQLQQQHPAFWCFPPQMFIDDVNHPYTTPPDQPFVWIRGRQVGGRSITWSGILLRMSDFELKAGTHDGAGEDWPLTHAELVPHYEKVESFLGLSGTREELPQLPDSIYAKPTALNALSARIKEVVEARWPELRVISPRGLAPSDLADDGWPIRSSPGSSLRAATATGRVTVRAGAVVARVLTDDTRPGVRGVEFVDADTGVPGAAYGNHVFLCASSYESVRLLLNSATPQFPTGLANSSGQLGTHLSEHFVKSIRGRLAQPTQITPGQASAFLIPRFQNLATPTGGFHRGYGVWGLVDPASDHTDVLFLIQGEVIPRPENRITIDPQRTDVQGIPVPHIRVGLADNEHRMIQHGTQFVRDVIQALGMELVEETMFVPGAYVHELGGARMGADPRTSVVDPYARSWDLGNLYVVDGACWPSSGWQNPSLTMLAIADRACDRLLRELDLRR